MTSRSEIVTSAHSKRPTPLLSVRELSIAYDAGRVVDNVSFDMSKGQRLGVIGESGSGKSLTALSILDLLRGESSSTRSGAVVIAAANGRIDLPSLTDKEISVIRGRRIGIIFQEPMKALNPVLRTGPQVAEVLLAHEDYAQREAQSVVLEYFAKLGLKDVTRVYQSYPHELSGGQLQRVCIAMALVGEPEVLICDEPTTALDATIQKQILDLIKSIVTQRGLSLLFISHDLAVIRYMCEDVLVMKDGCIVERGSVEEIFREPEHPYTRELMASSASAEVMANRTRQSKPNPILEVHQLSIAYPLAKMWPWSKRKSKVALKELSFTLYQSQILGIVGESGSGKSSLAKALTGLVPYESGQISSPLTDPNIQLIFQNPYASLHPNRSLGSTLVEVIQHSSYCKKVSAHTERDKAAMAIELLQKVGLDREHMDRLPAQLSGGQRQRVCIAKALATYPDVLICDESVSALDVTIRARILNLLKQLREEQGLSIIFISHDLHVVGQICDHVMVLEAGRLVEAGRVEDVLVAPKQRYTQQLLKASRLMSE